MSDYVINLGDSAAPRWVDKIAKRMEPKCRFVGLLDHRPSGGGVEKWVFWTPELREKYPNQYFSIYVDGDKCWVADADIVSQCVWGGLLHIPTGEVIFSRYRHDFRSFSFGGPCVDGGRAYMRIVGDLTEDYRFISLKCVDGVFKVVENA